MVALIVRSQSFTYLKLPYFTIIYYPSFGYPLLLYTISRGQNNDKKGNRVYWTVNMDQVFVSLVYNLIKSSKQTHELRLFPFITEKAIKVGRI